MTIHEALAGAAKLSTRLQPATEAQIDYLASLLAKAQEAGGNATSAAEEILSMVTTNRDGFGLTLRGASNHIETLKSLVR